MRKSKFSETQIVSILKEAEAGVAWSRSGPVGECRPTASDHFDHGLSRNQLGDPGAQIDKANADAEIPPILLSLQVCAKIELQHVVEKGELGSQSNVHVRTLCATDEFARGRVEGRVRPIDEGNRHPDAGLQKPNESISAWQVCPPVCDAWGGAKVDRVDTILLVLFGDGQSLQKQERIRHVDPKSECPRRENPDKRLLRCQIGHANLNLVGVLDAEPTQVEIRVGDQSINVAVVRLVVKHVRDGNIRSRCTFCSSYRLTTRLSGNIVIDRSDGALDTVTGLKRFDSDLDLTDLVSILG